MNLYEKIQAVSNEIKNIEKNLTVGSGSYGYKAVSESDVLAAVKKAESNHKLLSIPYKQEMLRNETTTVVTSKGKESVQHIHTIKMTTKIINLEKPEEFIEVESFGYGLDSGDKGLGKASTYARKYGLLNAYKIITGEDPDANKSEETEPLNEKELLNNIVNAFNENDPKGEVLNKTLTAFDATNIKDLNKNQLNLTLKSCIKKGWLTKEGKPNV